ncbi:terminase large subunit [Acidovorax phage ACP17]|uniref:Terminase large subunit n=1 Tax=Acidovorax phage ACP17 TaxID=2010329 RepID=A0A218M2V5_9CAUD|nr:terminase large subunit [Acidovorax phage ACP17]ASD50371.1 terminase large subunit [Acidovorax phage ACP17]
MNVFEKQEYMRCIIDIPYFVRTYVKIVSLDDGLCAFMLYPYQERMIEHMHAHRFSIFMTSRQMGKTTVAAGYLLHEAIFNKSFRIAILANKGDQAREIMSRIQLMYEELPWFMQPGVSEWNKGSIKLGNGTTMFTGATSSSSVRGKSINIVYMDEFAHIENDTEFYQSTYPVITSGKTTKVIITSTPNGMNLFYKIWTEAVNGSNDYKALQIFWHDHPKRDESWLEEQERNMPPKQIAQEIHCAFHGSSDTLISGSKLQKLVHKRPVKTDEKENLQIYAEVQPGRSYVITVDTAEGVGADSSVCSVFDVTQQPYKHVAKYRSNIIPPLMFAKVAFDMGMHYNNALLVVESNNSSGAIVVNHLWYDLEYDNMLTTRTKEGENKISGAARSQPGVRTTVRTKALGCSNLKAMIESDMLETNDFDTIQELSTFCAKGKSYEASTGKNDDCVMTLVLFAWFSNEPYFAEMVDADIKGILADRLAEQEEFHMLGVYFDDGTEPAHVETF